MTSHVAFLRAINVGGPLNAGGPHVRSRTAMLALIALLTAAFGQTQTPSYQAAIAAYRTALAALETHTQGRRDLEAAFKAAGVVRESLMQRAAADGSATTVIESLTAEEFTRLQDGLPGMIVNREEVLLAEPDPDFFVQLAVGHGDSIDRQFFAGFKATYPESVWPVYVEQQTDYSGCTKFGGGKLVDTYKIWSAFQRRFPGRYAATVRAETDRVIEALSGSTCACGDRPSIERELQLFARTFPSSPTRSKIDERLQALRLGRSDIRLHCISG